MSTTVNMLTAIFTAIAGWLGFFKSEHPDVGVARWGGNPADAKHATIERTVRRAAFALFAAATVLGLLGLLLADDAGRPTFEPLAIGGAVAYFLVAVVAMHEVVETFATARAVRHWWPAACESVRPTLERLEHLVRLGGVWPEREHEVGSWSPEEGARVRAMDQQQAIDLIAFSERLLELEHSGTLVDRVRRLRAAVE